MHNKGTWVGVALLVVSLLNGAWFLTEASKGTAIHGYIRDGHYIFVTDRLEYEVTKATWDWSYAHEISAYASFLIGVAGFALIVHGFGSALDGGTSSPGYRARRVDWVLQGQPVLGVFRCQSRVGAMTSWVGSRSKVTVTARGLVLGLSDGAPRAIVASEIDDRSWV
ncbi:MAG TPA: hypothetical protein VFY18_02840, partial [Candidatus Limnocylindrales bacterium]|nr:hypothetical protein [Candidatus Limnocylindrales bacterium]